MLFIRLGAGFGFLAVALGAFGTHGLRGVLSLHNMDIFQTAVTYMMYHALALIGFGLLKPARNWPGFAFASGIVVFSGSLFLIVGTGNLNWGMVTPVGGVLFLAGWAGFLFEKIT